MLQQVFVLPSLTVTNFCILNALPILVQLYMLLDLQPIVLHALIIMVIRLKHIKIDRIN